MPEPILVVDDQPELRLLIRLTLQTVGKVAVAGSSQEMRERIAAERPRVIVLDEPTRGVDVGAKRDIYALVHRLASEGRAVIIISSELIELIGLSHRVAVLHGGRLQAVLGPDQLSEENIISHATDTQHTRH